MLSGLSCGVALLISFYLLYYNIPYYCGSDFRAIFLKKHSDDIYKGRIWELFVVVVSLPGTAIWLVIEHITSGGRGILRFRGAKALLSIINIGLYLLAIHLLAVLHGAAVAGLDPGSAGIAQNLTGWAMDGYSLNLWEYIRISLQYSEYAAFFRDYGLWGGLRLVFLACGVNFLYYATLLGLLFNRIKPLHVASSSLRLQPSQIRKWDSVPSQLGKRLKNALLDFLDKQSVFRDMGYLHIVIAALILLAGFVVAPVYHVGLGSVLVQVLESSKLVSVLLSFLVSVVVARATKLVLYDGVTSAVGLVNPAAKRRIHQVVEGVSQRAAAVVESIDHRRREYAENHFDYSFNASDYDQTRYF